MESDLVKKENSWSHSNTDIVKNYFKNNFPQFQMLTETFYGPYWGVKFSNEEIVINVSGDIGFSIEITIGDSKFQLWQYDRAVNNVMKTTEENILYQLKVLKRFLDESPA
jgi:hypothetical protein